MRAGMRSSGRADFFRLAAGQGKGLCPNETGPARAGNAALRRVLVSGLVAEGGLMSGVQEPTTTTDFRFDRRARIGGVAWGMRRGRNLRALRDQALGFFGAARLGAAARGAADFLSRGLAQIV